MTALLCQTKASRPLKYSSFLFPGCLIVQPVPRKRQQVTGGFRSEQSAKQSNRVLLSRACFNHGFLILRCSWFFLSKGWELGVNNGFLNKYKVSVSRVYYIWLIFPNYKLLLILRYLTKITRKHKKLAPEYSFMGV